MPPRGLTEALKRQPFEPFRLHLSDGTVYEIHHPDLLMVGLQSAVVGVPAETHGDDPPLYERHHVIALSHIVRLEPASAETR